MTELRLFFRIEETFALMQRVCPHDQFLVFIKRWPDEDNSSEEILCSFSNAEQIASIYLDSNATEFYIVKTAEPIPNVSDWMRHYEEQLIVGNGGRLIENGVLELTTLRILSKESILKLQFKKICRIAKEEAQQIGVFSHNGRFYKDFYVGCGAMELKLMSNLAKAAPYHLTWYVADPVK